MTVFLLFLLFLFFFSDKKAVPDETTRHGAPNTMEGETGKL